MLIFLGFKPHDKMKENKPVFEVCRMTKEERLEDLKNKYKNDSDVQFVSLVKPFVSSENLA